MNTSMRVLVVDDSAVMRRITKTNLRQLGFNHVVEADSGADALTKLKSEKIDFVIVDSDMPQMGGVDLTKVMRADDMMKDTPVLLVMSKSDASRDKVREALQDGVNGYIVPPFTSRALNDKLKEIFG